MSPVNPIIRSHAAICDAVGEDQILEWRAAGWSVRKIRHELGIDTNGPKGGGGVRGLYWWLKQEEGRRDRWDEASVLAANSLADEAREIADGPDDETADSSERVARDKLRVEVRHYAAERMDPKTFSKPNAANVTLNLGGLHLTAVQQLQEEMRAERKALKAGTTPDEEIVDYSALLE